eukprot:Sspe_Gene.85535::Locus_56287_Transcript_1_1_Confidence_1.000_Length_1484::g.85535::m.85535
MATTKTRAEGAVLVARRFLGVSVTALVAAIIDCHRCTADPTLPFTWGPALPAMVSMSSSPTLPHPILVITLGIAFPSHSCLFGCSTPGTTLVSVAATSFTARTEMPHTIPHLCSVIEPTHAMVAPPLIIVGGIGGFPSLAVAASLVLSVPFAVDAGAIPSPATFSPVVAPMSPPRDVSWPFILITTPVSCPLTAITSPLPAVF